MIYYVAEYCLNSLNGTYFQSADAIKNADISFPQFFPLTAIFIAFIGINSSTASFILSELLFLYNLFQQVNNAFRYFVTKSILDYTQKYDCINKWTSLFFSCVPFLPIIMCWILDLAYISNSNRCKAFLARILYSLGEYATDLILERCYGLFVEDFVAMIENIFLFKKKVIAKILNFNLNYLVSYIFSRYYLKYQTEVSALLYSCTGSYFFLKTYSMSSFLSSFIDYKFNFSVMDKKCGIKNLAVSYAAFFTFVFTSFLYQKVVYKIVNKLKTKRKLE